MLQDPGQGTQESEQLILFLITPLSVIGLFPGVGEHSHSL